MHALTWSFTYFCDTIQIILIKVILQPSKNSMSLLMCVPVYIACYVSHQWYCCGNFILALVTLNCGIEFSLWKLVNTISVRTYVSMCAKDEITSSKSMWLHIYITIANSTYILSIKTCLHKCINVLKWTQPNCINTSVTYFTGQQPQATCICTVASLSHIYT